MSQMDQETFQYKVLQEAPDYKDSTIEKSGIKSTFTLREIEKHRADLTTIKTELEAQIKVQDATTTNIESFHPFVKDMSMEDMHAAGMFYEARGLRDKCQAKLDEIVKLLADEAAEEETIMTTLGLVKAEPVQTATEAVQEAAPEATPAVEPEESVAPEDHGEETPGTTQE